jgi:methyl-accepting chemotaxis protein
MHGQLVEITDRRMNALRELGNLRDEVNLQARAIRNIALRSNPEAVQAESQRIRTSRQSVDGILGRLDPLLGSEVEHAALKRIGELRGQYTDALDRYLGLLGQGQQQEAIALLFDTVRPLQQAYFASIQDASRLQNEQAELVSQQAKDASGSIELAAGVTTLGALLASVLLGLWIIRSITRPIEQSVAIARAVAAGDLTLKFDDSGKAETAQLLRALHEMQAGLARVVGSVRHAAMSVSTASIEFAQANIDLSSRTENQASALQQTSASMEQLGSTVRQNSDNARQANQLAQSASAVAEECGAVVAQVVDTMKDINESSHRIADIIGVIDGIAFQTNILALNASVEAARAGEQGRGFAVVATEVRNLASRSAEAAREIKGLISNSVERVGQGTQQVDRAGATMSEVVASIRRVTDIMGEISAASTEQSQGVSQVGQAVVQMDHSTQQNAALVEEMAASSDNLKQHAHELVQSVAVFKLAGSSAPAPQVDGAQAAAPAPAADIGIDLDTAIKAHADWKLKLRHAITNQETLDAATVSRDDCCMLGKWVHGPGGQRFGHYPVFVDLVDQHANFHQQAGRVAQTINQQEYQKASEMLGMNTPFTQASQVVIHAIRKLKNEAGI